MVTVVVVVNIVVIVEDDHVAIDDVIAAVAAAVTVYAIHTPSTSTCAYTKNRSSGIRFFCMGAILLTKPVII